MIECNDCQYFNRLMTEGGQCRFNPPNATVIMQQDFAGQVKPIVLTFYPEVANAYSCGQGLAKQSSIKLS